MSGQPVSRRANSDQITFWNDAGGQKWVRYQAMLDQQLDEVGALAMDAAQVKAGESVLDVGCGCGSTTLEIARRVGPAGRVTGGDISRPMLALARDRARDAGLANAAFLQADAQVFEFRPEYDLLFSRFGVMFFDDPPAAFANLHSSLKKSGARLAFVCWQNIQKNPWMLTPMMAALQHITIDAPPSPDAPGPFAFADPARVEGILATAGFRNVVLRGLELDLAIGGGVSLEETVAFLLEMGPLGRVLGGADEAVKAKVAVAVKDAIAQHAGDDGVRMAGSVWIVTADA
jgi:SAM-dependent methyltransferase